MTALSKTTRGALPAFVPVLVLALVLALGLGATPVLADGGGGGGATSTAWENPDYRAAVKEIDKKNYDAAIPLLQKVVATDPEHADAYNYLGYSHRQLGKVDEAVGFYQRALAIDPDHLGANEYLGELWLQVGDLAKAEKRLEVLDDACFFGCDQYYKLRDAIDDYKKKARSG